MTKKLRQKLNILKTKRAFEVKQKEFYITFKGLLVAKNCLRPESAPLKNKYWRNPIHKESAENLHEKKNPPKDHCEKFKAEPIRAKFVICHN